MKKLLFLGLLSFGVLVQSATVEWLRFAPEVKGQFVQAGRAAATAAKAENMAAVIANGINTAAKRLPEKVRRQLFEHVQKAVAKNIVETVDIQNFVSLLQQVEVDVWGDMFVDMFPPMVPFMQRPEITKPLIEGVKQHVINLTPDIVESSSSVAKEVASAVAKKAAVAAKPTAESEAKKHKVIENARVELAKVKK
jgi:hypothetical protein